MHQLHGGVILGDVNLEQLQSGGSVIFLARIRDVLQYLLELILPHALLGVPLERSLHLEVALPPDAGEHLPDNLNVHLSVQRIRDFKLNFLNLLIFKCLLVKLLEVTLDLFHLAIYI